MVIPNLPHGMRITDARRLKQILHSKFTLINSGDFAARLLLVRSGPLDASEDFEELISRGCEVRVPELGCEELSAMRAATYFSKVTLGDGFSTGRLPCELLLGTVEALFVGGCEVRVSEIGCERVSAMAAFKNSSKLSLDGGFSTGWVPCKLFWGTVGA